MEYGKSLKAISAEVVWQDAFEFIIEVVMIDREQNNKLVATSHKFEKECHIYDY